MGSRFPMRRVGWRCCLYYERAYAHARGNFSGMLCIDEMTGSERYRLHVMPSLLNISGTVNDAQDLQRIVLKLEE